MEFIKKNCFCTNSETDHILGTFRSEDEDDYEYEFSVLSTCTTKNVGLQTLCACSVCTGTRPRPLILRSLLSVRTNKNASQIIEHYMWLNVI